MAMSWQVRVIPLSEATDEEESFLGTWEPFAIFKDEGEVYLAVKGMFEVEADRSTVLEGPLKEWEPNQEVVEE